MSALPLSDIRVLDLSRLLPGGFCSLLLADLGAEVLKVEDTGMGDYIRWAPPYYGGEEQQALGTRSSLYLSLNRGKRFTSAALRPTVRWAGDPPDPDAIEELHRRSHELCFIANSVKTEIRVAGLQSPAPAGPEQLPRPD